MTEHDTIQRTSGCGWCITGHHTTCVKSITYYNTTWICGCNNPQCEESRKTTGDTCTPTPATTADANSPETTKTTKPTQQSTTS